ncbi:ATP-grasp domain-containing protein [Slackia heliotrinireducens]|uniref:ATP-grasp domain-containing protein n=1 Tax=Slackia heliotrinireducens TaxID=84110 RepID=UPI003314EA07
MTNNETQHRLMVLGSAQEFIELVRRAQARGIYVISCDGYPNGLAKAIADASFNIDVRDTQAIAKLCQEQRVDGIIASFSDLLAECLVNIADAAGLPCYAKPDRFAYVRDKTLMKGMFDELGIPHAKSVQVHKDTLEDDLSGITFPCVTKPVDSYGSRGVYVLDTVEEVRECFDEVEAYSNRGYIIVEEYVQGDEINAMTWLCDGKATVIGLADREKSVELAHAIPHVSRIIQPSKHLRAVQDDVCAMAEKIAAYIGIETGPLSMQFFYDEKRGITVCEAAGRLFGYEHELVQSAYGFSIEELLIDYVYDREAMKERLSGLQLEGRRHSAGLYFHAHEGDIAKILGMPSEDIGEVTLDESLSYYAEGERALRGAGAMPYAARIYITADTRKALDVVSADLYRDVKFLNGEGENLLFGNQLPAGH